MCQFSTGIIFDSLFPPSPHFEHMCCVISTFGALSLFTVIQVSILSSPISELGSFLVVSLASGCLPKLWRMWGWIDKACSHCQLVEALQFIAELVYLIGRPKYSFANTMVAPAMQITTDTWNKEIITTTVSFSLAFVNKHPHSVKPDSTPEMSCQAYHGKLEEFGICVWCHLVVELESPVVDIDFIDLEVFYEIFEHGLHVVALRTPDWRVISTR